MGGCCLVVGDELYIYVSGRRLYDGVHQYCSTGLAILRRDGFASMDARPKNGTLTTRLVKFRGKHLFVNVNNPHGSLRVEVLDKQGQPIPAFALSNSIPVTADKTLHPVEWKGVEDLSALSDQPARFRFHLDNGELYSFWVSPDRSGGSILPTPHGTCSEFLSPKNPRATAHRLRITTEGDLSSTLARFKGRS